MSEIASASINTFGTPSPKADFVPPSEEQIFVLTASQLSDLITAAVEKAVQPLQDRIDALEATAATQGAQLAVLEATEEQDVTRLAVDIAYDRRRIAALEHPAKEPGKTELSRVEKIEKYLSSRPDHRATFETLKGYLGVDKFLLNNAIKTLMDSSPGKYGIIRAPGDKRKRTLIMLSR